MVSKKEFTSRKINGNVLELVRGDITAQETEAVVNAANRRLAPGGGVAGAIHRAAGPELWEECKELDGCRTGEAKITGGYDLAADYVIHTVGPVYSNSPEDPKLLKSSYRNSLELAWDNDIKSISFPALSTGAFGYPEEPAGRIALEAMIDFLRENDTPGLVRLVLYGGGSYDLHVKLLEELLEE